MFTKPNLLLRVEGFAIFALALAIYWQQGFSWPLFWATVLLPDLALLGYLANPHIGATVYNITHAKLLPAALALTALATGSPLLLSLALVWFVHIGADRALGYGLKYPEDFHVTHLGVIGQVANAGSRRLLPCGK